MISRARGAGPDGLKVQWLADLFVVEQCRPAPSMCHVEPLEVLCVAAVMSLRWEAAAAAGFQFLTFV
jgi:hypothetical protein